MDMDMDRNMDPDDATTILPLEPPGPPGPPAPPRRRGRSVVAGVRVGLMLLGAGVGIGWGFAGESRGGSSSPGTGTLPSSGSSGGSSLADIASKLDGAVVDINTFVNLDSLGSNPFPGGELRPLGAGTG